MSGETKQDPRHCTAQGGGTRLVEYGRHLAHWHERSPRRMLHCLSYYKFASRLIGPGKRILDIGCGEGIGTWLLAVENGFAHGVDLDENAMDHAARNFGHDPRIRFSCGDFFRLPVQQWDAVVTFDVIEHILPDNVPAFWRRLADNLTHDGILVVGTPNITSDQYANPYSRAGHVNLYSGDRLGEEMGRYFHHVFLFAGNDEVVHTGFLPMAHYLLAVGCRKRAGSDEPGLTAALGRPPS
jgi:2-polyprenyl-3-methyl-5-hydroxy-6-metoxy-1,4-benzoquinol methylase